MTTANGSRFTVMYTDPKYMIRENQFDLHCADVERQHFGAEVMIRASRFENGAYELYDTEFDAGLADAHALVVNRAVLREVDVDKLSPHCKVVIRQGVGIDNMPMDAIKKRGIAAYNVPDYCVDEVANHTIAMILDLNRKITFQDACVKRGEWKVYAGGVPQRMAQLTCGIVGFGRIGRATARKAGAFFSKIAAYDPWVHPEVMYGYGAEPVETLKDLLSISDYLVLHCDLNDTSRQMINEHSLGALKEGAYIINTARGELVNADAILRGLKSRKIGGYASDVYAPEIPFENPTTTELAVHERSITTAHRAFLSEQAEIGLRARVAKLIKSILLDNIYPSNGRLA